MDSLLSSEGDDFKREGPVVRVNKAGFYRVDYSVQFAHTGAATTSIGHETNPSMALVVNGVSQAETERYRPVLHVNIALVLTLRVLIDAPLLSYSGVIHLEAGDELRLDYADPGKTPQVPVTATLTLQHLS